MEMPHFVKTAALFVSLLTCVKAEVFDKSFLVRLEEVCDAQKELCLEKYNLYPNYGIIFSSKTFFHANCTVMLINPLILLSSHFLMMG